jgi:hypothetical protein
MATHQSTVAVAAGAAAAVASAHDDDACVQPDVVTSSNNNTEEFTLLFDEEEYQYLRKRYLEKRVNTHVALPHSGMRLRRQTKRAAIECNSPGYRALRDEIRRRCLDCAKKNQEIYCLLRQLAEWETKQGRFPTLKTKSSEKEKDSNEVVEVIDLSNEDEREEHVIDVDTFIIEILLVKVKQEPHTAEVQDASEEGAFEGLIAPDPVVSDAVVEGGVVDNSAQPPIKDVLQPIMVEFKFRNWSEETKYDPVGVFRVPLLQDLESGFFSLPSGKGGKVESGKLGIEGTFYPPTDCESEKSVFDVVGNHFTGVIKFSDDGEAKLVLNLTWSERRNCFLRAIEEHDSSKLCSTKTTNLHEWVRRGGGLLSFACQGKHHSKPILLYTRLSEDQTGSNALALPIFLRHGVSQTGTVWNRCY